MTDITKTAQWQRTGLCSLITHPNIWLLTACTSAKRDAWTRTVLMLQARRLPNCHGFARLIGTAVLKRARNSFKVGEEQVMSLFMLVIIAHWVNQPQKKNKKKNRKSKLYVQLDFWHVTSQQMIQIRIKWTFTMSEENVNELNVGGWQDLMRLLRCSGWFFAHCYAVAWRSLKLAHQPCKT